MKEIIKAERDGSVWIRAKVTPGKGSLDFFMQKWKESGSGPFSGEFTPPVPDATGQVPLARIMTQDVSRISHCIIDVDAEKYDAVKATVPIRCKFTGPRGSEAQELFLNGELRSLARVAVDPKTNEPRIVTFDMVPSPDKELINDLYRDKERREEKARKHAYDNRKK